MGKVMRQREASSGKKTGDISEHKDVTFANKEEANEILELVRYANVQAHKPLVEEELLFIAKYPKIAKKLLTHIPLE
jgi:homocitrate synthase NifV